jgi:uncharacterized protein with GYD domain
MPTYIVLGNYTEQGIRGIKDTVKRTESAKQLAQQAGATLKETFWTLGQVDLVAIFEAPDDATMTAVSLSIAGHGNVRTQTLRAFSAGDIQTVLSKVR